jgi:putative nucleotidyltransferase with HDIG domain
VKKVMRRATEEDLLGRLGTREPAFNYRWEHVSAVAVLAVRLSELTGADQDVVEAAAWLHDICKEAKERHPQEGAKFAREFLPTTDFPPDKVERVAQAIEDHMGLWRDEPLSNLESQVLWDADKLAKIGLTAVFHWMGNLLTGRKPTTLEDMILYGRNADWQAKAVASMHTEPARLAAERRFLAYNQLWDNLEFELNGFDLFS